MCDTNTLCTMSGTFRHLLESYLFTGTSLQGVEFVDMSSIDDIAAIIGSAIADTTVPNQTEERDGTDSRDSWMDLDAWIDGNCMY